jgi:ribonuclease R
MTKKPPKKDFKNRGKGPPKRRFGGNRNPHKNDKHVDGLPEVVVAEVMAIDPDGEAVCLPVDRDPNDPKPPRIFLQPSTGHAALGVGEKALLRVKRLGLRNYAGTVLKRIAGDVARMVGLYQESEFGARLVPTDRRQREEVVINAKENGGAKHGELVLAEIMPGKRAGLPHGKIIERLGFADAPKAISLIAIHMHELPFAFPPEVEEEANKCKRPTLGQRTDLRDVPLVTIDGKDARDFDDAVYAQADGEGWKLLVAIADVAEYVRPGSALDRSAYERGNSTYFPDRVVPMLPEALSNDLCSLRPNEDRACLAVWMWVDKEGRMYKYEFVRGLMKSRARLTYEQVQEAQDGATDSLTAPLLEPVIKPLYEAYKCLLAARNRRGTLELDLPERKVEISADGKVAGISPRARLDSHRLIEEFMILTNVAAARALEDKGMACMYRVHEPPSPAKLEALRDFLKPLGFSIPQAKQMEPKLFRKVLEEAEANPLSELISTVILRSQSQARYDPENLGHFGLALERYAHFTSPIRRYADLIVHRGLIAAYGLGEGGLTSGEIAEMKDIAEQISNTERRSATAERSAVDRYTALYLAEHQGAVFEGKVSGVTRFGLFISLDETGADGLIPMNLLGDDRYEHDEKHHCLIGKRDGHVYRLGARCKVKLLEADALQGSTTFSLVSIDQPQETWPPANQRSKSFKKQRRR